MDGRLTSSIFLVLICAWSSAGRRRQWMKAMCHDDERQSVSSSRLTNCHSRSIDLDMSSLFDLVIFDRALEASATAGRIS
jgi:hypothetical protein